MIGVGDLKGAVKFLQPAAHDPLAVFRQLLAQILLPSVKIGEG